MSVASRWFSVYGPTDYGFKPFNVLNPGVVYEYCRANGIDTSPFWGKANRIVDYIGLNPQPSYLLIGGPGAAELYRTLQTPAGASAYRQSSSHMIVMIHGSDFTRTISQPSYVPRNALAFGQLYVTKMIQIGPNGDGNAPYLLELHDSRYHANRRCFTDSAGGGRPETRVYNVRIPGSPLSAGYNTGAAVSWETIFDAAFRTAQAPRSWGNLTLPSITEAPDNFSLSGNPIEAIKYILEIHNRTIHIKLLSPNETSTVAELLELGVSSSSVTAAMDALAAQGREVFKYVSKFDDQYLDYPGGDFSVFFQKKWIPITHQANIYHNQQDIEYTSNVAAPPSTVDNFDGIYTSQVCTLFSPMFAELNHGSTTPNNASDLQDLADEYNARFMPRITTANVKLHRIFSGIVDTVAVGNQVHEMIYRDYGDRDGMVTEIRGGREILKRLLGEPLGMLSKPLMCHPELGIARRPEAVNTTRAIGHLTNPTTNTFYSTTIYTGNPGAESSTGLSVSAYYIGPTIASGTKRVQVFSNSENDFYSV